MAHCFGYYFCLFPFRRLYCAIQNFVDNAQSFASFFVCSTSLDTCAFKNTCSPVVFLDTCTCATCFLSVVFWPFLFLFLRSSFLASSFLLILLLSTLVKTLLPSRLLLILFLLHLIFVSDQHPLFLTILPKIL